jgi:hypothetical protein
MPTAFEWKIGVFLPKEKQSELNETRLQQKGVYRLD